MRGVDERSRTAGRAGFVVCYWIRPVCGTSFFFFALCLFVRVLKAKQKRDEGKINAQLERTQKGGATDATYAKPNKVHRSNSNKDQLDSMLGNLQVSTRDPFLLLFLRITSLSLIRILLFPFRLT